MYEIDVDGCNASEARLKVYPARDDEKTEAVDPQHQSQIQVHCLTLALPVT
jgi:hypothetical protein